MGLAQGEVELLCLEIKKRQRVPPGVKQRLHNVNSAHTGSTERIFLDHGGLPACAAYLFTKHIVEDVKSRSFRKSAREKLVTTLDNLSVEDRQLAAGQVKAVIESDAARIEEWIRASLARAMIRNRVPKTSSDNAGSEQSNGDSGLNNPCDSISLLPSPGSNEPTHRTADHDSSSQSSQDVSHERDRSLRMHEASITACNFVFPEYLVGAIMRQSKLGGSSTAAVYLTPTQDDRVACLSMDLTPKRIEHIARELFSVCLENEAGIRYVCVGQTRLMPTQELALEWCRLESIPLIFGSVLAGAVSSGPVYEQERLEEEERTKCVSMIVSRAAHKCARVEVLLPLERATEIKNLLSQLSNCIAPDPKAPQPKSSEFQVVF